MANLTNTTNASIIELETTSMVPTEVSSASWYNNAGYLVPILTISSVIVSLIIFMIVIFKKGWYKSECSCKGSNSSESIEGSRESQHNYGDTLPEYTGQ